MKTRLALLVSLLALPLRAAAADLPVRYLAEEKPLKAAVAGTSLAFELYGDNACTTLIQSVLVNVEDVTILSKLTQMTPKNDTKLPSTVELRATLNGVPNGAVSHLKVTGTGVTPVGGACQAQAQTTVPGLVLKDSLGTVLGPAVPDFACNGTGRFMAMIQTVSGVVLAGPYFNGTALTTCTGNYVYFASTNCSGTALSFPQLPQQLVISAGVVNSTLYVPATSGASVMSYNSQLFEVNSMSSCNSAGQTFIPPRGCCGTVSNTAALAPVVDTKVFAPPFSVVFP